jgi:hypothetical protein
MQALAEVSEVQVSSAPAPGRIAHATTVERKSFIETIYAKLFGGQSWGKQPVVLCSLNQELKRNVERK